MPAFDYGPLALLVTAILATLVLYFWAKKAQAEKQLAQMEAENERLLSAAEDLKARMASMGRKAAGDRKLDTLERLCEQYYVYEGTENLHPRILKEVRSIIEGLRADPSVQGQLEQSLNESNDGVMEKLRADFPKLKDEDYLLFLFVASGFSSTTISALLEKDKPYVYNRLYRLKERIKQSGTKNRELYLDTLAG